MPEHLVHWRVDFDNPFKKHTVPLHTLFEFEKEVKIHQMICDSYFVSMQERENKYSRSSFASSKIMDNYYARIDMPIQIITGSHDEVVCNKRSKQIYELLKLGKGMDKSHNFEVYAAMDHSPFADGMQVDKIIAKTVEFFDKSCYHSLSK